jgi:hypothetical protein
MPLSLPQLTCIDAKHIPIILTHIIGSIYMHRTVGDGSMDVDTALVRAEVLCLQRPDPPSLQVNLGQGGAARKLLVDRFPAFLNADYNSLTLFLPATLTEARESNPTSAYHAH